MSIIIIIYIKKFKLNEPSTARFNVTWTNDFDKWTSTSTPCFNVDWDFARAKVNDFDKWTNMTRLD